MNTAEMTDEEATRHAASLIPNDMIFENKDMLYRYICLITRKRQGGGPLPMHDRHQLWRVACRLWTQGSAVPV
jgi:hypothetical protein